VEEPCHGTATKCPQYTIQNSSITPGVFEILELKKIRILYKEHTHTIYKSYNKQRKKKTVI
jgi:ethanolamine utilization cobalamin adenosyltransferase